MFNLQIVETNGLRVLTTRQIAVAYGVTEKLIQKNFENNKSRYVEGKYYMCLKGEDLQSFLHTQNLRLQNQSKIRHLYLWTEKGALLHAKSLNTDKAWEVYEYLVDYYFRVKEEPKPAAVPKLAAVLERDICAKEVSDCLTAMEVTIDQHMKLKSERNMATLEKTLNVFWVELGQRISKLENSWELNQNNT